MDSLMEIRKRRQALGIPVRDLARAVGRSVATVSRIERGRIRPSYELAQAIFRFLEAQEGEASPHLLARDVMNPGVTTLDASTSLAAAGAVMERRGFSQVPVVEEGRITGGLSDTGLLKALADPGRRKSKVADVQEPGYPQVGEEFPADLLATLLTRYPAVLVAHRGELRGIVTKTDLIRGLRHASLRRKPTSTA
ncbi:MAG: CBS domain-containing protein [Euryarchaeota archaeon]|nr:CBS domain-containing protein [Euryarchaeota archaeon]MDE1835452.1 CBS domain-containing protein [Euryarchaeota archaeon]MDE1879588.1 CBS domain-containing protein [Euryarchaeota archaeon]MDE2046308.1 CBS domain-containing protein [Thermoplasmata archaeon]